MRNIVFGGALGLALVVGCATPPSAETTETSSSHIEGGDSAAGTTTDPDAAPSPDVCGTQASQARAKATFDRTTSCALNAATAGFGEKVELAGRIFGDVKQVAAVIKRVAGALNVTNLSTARAVMCVRVVGGYAISKATRATLTAGWVGLTDGDIDTLFDQATSTFTLGASGTFAAFNAMSDAPSVENLVNFLAAMVGNVATVANFVNTCGSVLAEFGTVSLPSIAKYSSALSTLGTVTAIAQCGAAVIENAVDVGTELYCLAQDYKHIAEQEATLQNMNDDRCEAFAEYVQNPALRPILESGGDTSEDRTNACYQVMHHWGSCVYNAKRSGLFGDTALTCDECARVCTAYVNGAGDNAYLQPVIDGAMDHTNANDPVAVRSLVMAAGTCMAQVAPNDGIQPCINFCRGQVADCP
jgi:hypothetical protein